MEFPRRIHPTNMRLLFFLISLLLIGCHSKRIAYEMALPSPGSISVQFVEAEDTEDTLNYELYGKAFDVNSEEPMPFVKVVLRDKNDSTYIVGAHTDLDGQFSIKCREGAYWLEVTYAGYSSVREEIMGFGEVREGIEILIED